MRRFTWVLLCAMLLAGLNACSSLFSFTPERAVVQEILRSNSGRIIPGSMQVLQSLKWNEITFVYVRFQTIEEDGNNAECVTLNAVTRHSGRWANTGGGGSCWSGLGAGEKSRMSLSFGQHSDDELVYSTADGLVHESDIKEIKLTWEDGQTSTAEVINDSYVIVREGAHTAASVVGLDENGEEVFTDEMSPHAPGKGDG